jgi:N-acetylmuramoyl-L-alanine amidase
LLTKTLGRVDVELLIYLDGGHGGKDGGAAGNGIKEKDIVLEITKRIKAGLEEDYQDVEILMSRETDIFLTLDERTRRANAANANVFVSVHCNSATATAARGFETYIFPDSGSPTVAFQNVMHSEIIKEISGFAGFTDRGKKQANFAVLRQSKMNAILTENLFISNPADAALLQRSDYLQAVSQGHINGLEKFLGLRKIERPPRTEPTGKLYRVQVGAFEEKKNAEALAADLSKQGYRPYVKYE